ncbi:MAG TPA: RNA pseudouridine synthase [Clostridiales bacterium]|nr:RNA pseudouridine synthase [Clostridiales bacterium]
MRQNNEQINRQNDGFINKKKYGQARIKVIFEDNHLLVVEKPVNMLSQGDSTQDRDLLTILKEDIKERYNKPGNVFLGLVHRLDRPVGGVMVFAKTSKAASRLSEQIRMGEFDKKYLAVVNGKPASEKARLEHFLIKDEKTNMVKVLDNGSIILSNDNEIIRNDDKRIVEGNIKGIKGNKDAKKAVLDYQVLETGDKLSLVYVNLITGRSHQIRAQFSASGCPLYGDQKYGVELNKKGQQLALWSYKITLKHPVGKHEMSFQCNPPDAFPWNIFNSGYLILT